MASSHPRSSSSSAAPTTSNAKLVQQGNQREAIEQMALTAPAGAPDPLSRYTLVRTLRKTLQGCVALMNDRETGRPVAVKCSLRQLVDCRRSASGVRIAEDVVREARLLKRLSSRPCPNLVQLVEHVEDSARHCLVMEFAEGGELFDYIESVGLLTENLARGLFLGIVRGLAFMHDHSVCHLDLSLENVLLDADMSTPKICDLGLARVFRQGEAFRGSKLARPGKLSYMAPEVFAGDDFFGDRADIWSLGCVLFVILFGFPPFEVASDMDVRYQFMRGRGLRALLSEWNLRFHVSEDALDLLSMMLSPHPTRIKLDSVLQHRWLRSAVAEKATTKPVDAVSATSLEVPSRHNGSMQSESDAAQAA